MKLEELIAAARGEVEVDLLIEGAEVVNTLSGERRLSEVAISGGTVVGFDCESAKKTVLFYSKILKFVSQESG